MMYVLSGKTVQVCYPWIWGLQNLQRVEVTPDAMIRDQLIQTERHSTTTFIRIGVI